MTARNAPQEHPPWWPGPVWFPPDQLPRDIADLKRRFSADSSAGSSAARKENDTD